MSETDEVPVVRAGERLGKLVERTELVTRIVVFFGSYIYCIATYGYLWGVGLGWLPSLIIAVVAGFLVGVCGMTVGLPLLVAWHSLFGKAKV